MDRLEVRGRARELLDQVYMTAPPRDGREAGSTGLVELARTARAEGAPLDRFVDGPWRSAQSPCAHGGVPPADDLSCVTCGEFELPVPRAVAADVAALLNWAEVPEPGAQT